MAVFAVLTCCCIPNFIEIGSRVTVECSMRVRCHGNRIIADMSGT